MLDLLHNEGLENIANLDIVEFFKTDTALVAGSHFAGIVLKSLKRGNLILKDHNAVTNNADLRLTGNLTVLNIGACNGANVGYVNGLAYLCVTEQVLAELGCEHIPVSVCVRVRPPAP